MTRADAPMATTTSAFSDTELPYLQGERRLARIATVGRDGAPHVVPVGMWTYNPEEDDPWRPRAVEVRGRAEAIHDPQPLIRIHPERVASGGLE